MPTLIVLSHLRWGFVYQRPQHLMSRLARHYKVLFVEEPLHDDAESRIDVAPHGQQIDVLTPRTRLPQPGFHDEQLAVLGPLLARYLNDNGIDDYIVWLYTPMALPMLEPLKPRLVIYDCMDELSAFKNAPRELREREAALMRRAAVVFTGGPALYEAKVGQHENLHCLPSSVDAPHYAPSRLDPESKDWTEAQRLHADLGRPRLGFFGVIDERLDLDLLQQLAAARPSWSIVMVGPVAKIDEKDLPKNPNIRWLGMQSYARLPHLMAQWDVCLMPFALNDSTRFISPTKTLEYMAGDKPVVSTAVHDVIKLYGDVVCIADSPEAFIAGCEAALAQTEQQRAAHLDAMRETVSRVSWDRSADIVQQELAKALQQHPAASA
ncbi:MAG TPA: glycosyltransferase [Rubrivivax sp.]|nr:glycosyltransferase [Rubrivivax sp.]